MFRMLNKICVLNGLTAPEGLYRENDYTMLFVIIFIIVAIILGSIAFYFLKIEPQKNNKDSNDEELH